MGRTTARPLQGAAPLGSTRILRSQTTAQAPPSKVTKPKPKSRRRRADPWAPKCKVNPNPKPRAPPRKHFTCRVCVEEQTPDQFPTWIRPGRQRWTKDLDVPLSCIAHLGRNPSRRSIRPVCKGCIGNTMAARLDMLGARRVGVGCLEPGCDVTWHWNFIMKYMPRGAPLEKYNVEMFEVWKQEVTPKLVTCISPNCDAIGLPDTSSPGYPQISCDSCAVRFCAQCLVPWHADITCAERAAKYVDEKMSDPEKDTLKLMQAKDAKRCPSCQLVIEKDGGCNSMLCIGCQKFFNWATAASAIPGAKKAEPFSHIDPYMHTSNPVVCELDALRGTAEALVVAATA